MGLLSVLFGEKTIQYDLKQAATQDAIRYASTWDFDTYGSLKKAITDAMTNYACPSCSCRGVTGAGVVCVYGKVHLYRQDTVKGWLFGTRTKKVFMKSVWTWLRTEVIGDGKMKCPEKSCGWSRTKDSKEKPCSDCRGAGTVAYSNVNCGQCGGSGEFTCTYTEGFLGTYAKCSGGIVHCYGDGRKRACPSCNGRGFQRCGGCSGRGVTSGSNTCSRCGGRGKTY